MKIEISQDKSKLDIEFIHNYLTKTYWAEGRSAEQVKQSIENSICYGVYKEGNQIGFARVLTDFVAFAYIMDVFIIDKEQGNGYAKHLMKEILSHPEIQKVQKWFLGTRDAEGLYSQFGFEIVNSKIKWMQFVPN